MKRQVILLALALGVYSSASSGGFDFGKVLEAMGQAQQ
jgi:hypothetical protein